MESGKLDIKELLLVTKIKNTNEKIKWVVIGSFLFSLLVTTLAGITLFSRYLDKVLNSKREDIVVRLQMPDNKMPLPFMYPPATTWPFPSFEKPVLSKPEPTPPVKTLADFAEQQHHHHHHNLKLKAKPKQTAVSQAAPVYAPTKKLAENAQPNANATVKKRPKTIGKLTSDVIPPGYIKIGEDLYFNPKLSRYLIKWK